MEYKDNLLKYIKTKYHLVNSITDYKINDSDDEEGYAYENMFVNAVFKCPDPTYSVNNLFGRRNHKLLVKVNLFRDWLNREDAIKIVE